MSGTINEPSLIFVIPMPSVESPMANTECPTDIPLLTINDVANFCRVSPKTAWRWVKSGDLAAYKLGAQWRVSRRDLDLFIRERWRG